MTLSAATSAALARAGLDPAAVLDLVGRAVAEDLDGGEDVTSVATVPADLRGVAAFVPRADGTLAGVGVALAVLDVVVPGVELRALAHDGDTAVRGQAVVEAEGPVRSLLTAERTALNLLCHLSGVATTTAAWVDAVAGTGAVIRDSRKTLPGLRTLQKYAVRCGGGVNHRMGLGDAVLIKDNHVAAGSVTAAIAAVRAHARTLSCEVEVGSLDELDEALAAGASLVLLDNMTVPQCAEAVRRTTGSGTKLEVSGGLTLDVAWDYAQTGVRYLAVGALTHSAPALDLGLDLMP